MAIQWRPDKTLGPQVGLNSVETPDTQVQKYIGNTDPDINMWTWTCLRWKTSKSQYQEDEESTALWVRPAVRTWWRWFLFP